MVQWCVRVCASLSLPLSLSLCRQAAGRIMRVNHVKDYRPVKDGDGQLIDTTCAPEAVLPASLRPKTTDTKG